MVQHISTFSRLAGTGDWVYTFTQEWPLPDEKHQLSFTLPVQDLHSAVASASGVGDVALNYRYQAAGHRRGSGRLLASSQRAGPHGAVGAGPGHGGSGPAGEPAREPDATARGS